MPHLSNLAVRNEFTELLFSTCSRYCWNYCHFIFSRSCYDHRSYERNLSNCVEKPEKVRTSTGFDPVTSRYRCDALTNCVMKPLTLGAGHLWVVMSPWRMDAKWYMKCFIYWTADLKSSKLWPRWSPDFFRLLIRNCLNCVYNCDDHSLLDFKSAVQYMKHFIYHFK